jgi:hypothetical protein
MLPGPISFELPDWKEPPSVGSIGLPEWFERLFGQDGGGAFLTSPVQLWRRPAKLWGDN